MKIDRIGVGVTNVYLVREGRSAILIDSGPPNRRRALELGLERLGVSKGDISLAVMTHYHWDHIGNTKHLCDRWGAKVATHRLEAKSIRQGEVYSPPGLTAWGGVMNVLVQLMIRSMVIAPSEVELEMGEDDVSLEPYGIAGKVIHTPGHSPGSVSVLLETGEAFVGDLAMNGPPLTLRPGLPIFGEDRAEVVVSWKKLLGKGARVVFPAHGKPFPSSIMERVIEGK